MSNYGFTRSLRSKISLLVQAVRHEEGAIARLAAYDAAPRYAPEGVEHQAKADAAWQKERDTIAAFVSAQKINTGEATAALQNYVEGVVDYLEVES